MKRIIALALTLIMVLSLAGCGGSSSGSSAAGGAETQAAADLNLEEVYQAIVDLQKDSEEGEIMLIPETDDALIEEYYAGLSNFELKQKVIAFSPVTGGPMEVALVEAANASDVEGIKKCFEERIERGGGCGAESQNTWENRSGVQVSGNYVCMIVLPEGFIIPDDVFALVK